MIKKEDLRKEINKGLQNSTILNYAFNVLRAEWEPNENNIKKRASFEAQLKQVKGTDPDENEEQTAEAFLTVVYQAIRDSDYFINEDPDAYKNVVDYVTDGADLRKETVRKITPFPFFVVLIQLYRIVFNIVLRSSGDLNEKISSTIAVNILVNGAELDTEPNSPTVKALKEAGEDLDAWADIAGLYAEIRERLLKGDELIEEEEKNGLIPRIAYDTEMQISHSRYITTLVENGFKLNESVFNESEDTLNSLESEDNDILDLLILNWYAHGIRRFTDRQVAVALYHGGNSNADVSKKELQKINESIERLRRTEIKQGVESSEDIGNTKLKYTQRPFLISVLPQDIEHEGDTTVYDFTGVQGYEEYALITKRMSKYNNALITADIKGIQHDFKNDTLKRLLVRRITGLEYNKRTAIDMREVYEVLEITDPRNYTYAKKKVKAMLEELRNEKNDTYYNFGYEFKKRNKATILTFIRSNEAPLNAKKPKEIKLF